MACDIWTKQLRRLAKDSCCRRIIPKFWYSALPLLPRNCEAHGSRRSDDRTILETRILTVPKLKIRRRGIVDDIPPPHPVPSAVSVLGVTVLQTPETMVGSSFFISPTPGVTSGVSSASFPAGPMPSLKNSRQLGKRKAGAHSRKEAFQTPIPPPASKYEYINIRSRRDELDPIFLGKLPAPTAIATASVHKYRTSAFGKAADNAELTELLKLVEMYTSQSHVLNCELYKVLAIKVDELRSTVGGNEDVNALCLENKDI
ncbi:hypothetical protein Fot_11348 [Forsythia ovata]|uniref:Uncharacterized protein n=1 Tax=Forsythia ovata TaxID=205694 RepID=A0ABD1WM55_9LAMI